MEKITELLPKYITLLGGAVVVLSVYVLSGNLTHAVLGYGAGVGVVSAVGKLLRI